MMPAFWLAPSLTQPTGREIAMPWSYFADRVERARAAQSKDGLARWAPVEFRGARRCLGNVRRVHAIVVDADDGSSLETILGALAGLFVIVHSTFSATAEHPRWRIIVPLDWPTDADDYARVWRWLASKLEGAGVRPDYSARDASRAWAVPARPPGGFYVARVIDGAFASTEEALATIPAPEPLPIPKVTTRDDCYGRRVERAAKYLAAMPGAISGSGGHAATFAAAVKMVRGFEIDPDDALALLIEIHNPLCAPAWSEPELRHKVNQAHQRGRLPFGFIADRGRAA